MPSHKLFFAALVAVWATTTNVLAQDTLSPTAMATEDNVPTTSPGGENVPTTSPGGENVPTTSPGSENVPTTSPRSEEEPTPICDVAGFYAGLGTGEISDTYFQAVGIITLSDEDLSAEGQIHTIYQNQHVPVDVKGNYEAVEASTWLCQVTLNLSIVGEWHTVQGFVGQKGVIQLTDTSTEGSTLAWTLYPSSGEYELADLNEAYTGIAAIRDDNGDEEVNIAAQAQLDGNGNASISFFYDGSLVEATESFELGDNGTFTSASGAVGVLFDGGVVVLGKLPDNTIGSGVFWSIPGSAHEQDDGETTEAPSAEETPIEETPTEEPTEETPTEEPTEETPTEEPTEETLTEEPTEETLTEEPTEETPTEEPTDGEPTFAPV